MFNDQKNECVQNVFRLLSLFLPAVCAYWANTHDLLEILESGINMQSNFQKYYFYIIANPAQVFYYFHSHTGISNQTNVHVFDYGRKVEYPHRHWGKW